MTYPVDQIITLSKANGQLLLKFAEIARSLGEDYAGIGEQGLTAAIDQVKTIEPGKLPSFSPVPATTLLSALEKSREAAAGKAKAAFEEWQAVWKEAFAAEGPQEAVAAFQKLIAPWIKEAEKSARAAPEAAPSPAPAASSTEE